MADCAGSGTSFGDGWSKRDDVLNVQGEGLPGQVDLLQLYRDEGRITPRMAEGRVVPFLTINTGQIIARCSVRDSNPRRDKCSVSDQHSQQSLGPNVTRPSRMSASDARDLLLLHDPSQRLGPESLQ